MPTIDQIASLARTALDDPGAIGLPYRDGVNDYDPSVATSYAIDRLDEIINALNPAEETSEAYAATLTILGRHLAERRDAIEDRELLPAIYAEAVEEIGLALDHLDAAIAALTQDDDEDPRVNESDEPPYGSFPEERDDGYPPPPDPNTPTPVYGPEWD